MPTIFLDTNALLKLYVSERGSTWLRGFVASQQVAISELALFEVANVLRRRHVEGAFTRVEAIDLFGQISRDSAAFEIIPLGGSPQLDRLMRLLFRLPEGLRVRALDSLHLTAAEIASEDVASLTPPEPFVFVSSDLQLLRVAQANGFVTENPESYP